MSQAAPHTCASLMLSVSNVTMILFTGFFTILIVANLLGPAAAALACKRDAAGHHSPRHLTACTLLSSWYRHVYLIEPGTSQLQKNMHPHHIICSMPQNPWECSSNLTLRGFFFRRESEVLIKSRVEADPQWVMFPKEHKPIDFPLPFPLKQGSTCRGKTVVHLLPRIKFAAVYRLVILHIWIHKSTLEVQR